jgi:hypothetical protein
VYKKAKLRVSRCAHTRGSRSSYRLYLPPQVYLAQVTRPSPFHMRFDQGCCLALAAQIFAKLLLVQWKNTRKMKRYSIYSTSTSESFLASQSLVGCQARCQVRQLRRLRASCVKYVNYINYTLLSTPVVSAATSARPYFPLNSKNTKTSPTKRPCRRGCASHRS